MMKNISQFIDKIALRKLLYRVRNDYMTPNNIVITIAAIIVLGWIWGSIEAMQRNYDLQQMVAKKQHQVEVEKLHIELLGYESKYYASHEYLDLSARRRLGLGLPGEHQIITPSTDEASAPQERPIENKTSISNFQKWMNLLFGGRANHKK